MKTFKGTKGKWEVEKRITKSEVSVISEGKRICQVKSFDGIAFNDPTTKQANSNAKLIASAPELLELCLLVHGSFGGGNVITFSETDIENFENVINKILS